jgi:hypothetical protein
MTASRPKPRSRPAARPQLRVVGGSGKSRRRSPVPIVILVVLTVFGVVAIQAIVGQDGLKASKLEGDVNQESERNALLRARVAQLTNANRVADEATKLGLVGFAHPIHIKVATNDNAVFRRTGVPSDLDGELARPPP